MQREIHTHNIAQRASSPEVAQLIGAYELARGADGIVAYRDFNTASLQRWRDCLMLVVPDRQGDYRFLNVGMDILRCTALPLEGRSAGELPGDLALFTVAAYDRARREMQPVATFFQTDFGQQHSSWEQLILPTRAPDGTTMLMAFVRRLGFREELLTSLLETSPNGILVLRRQGQGDQVLVVAANPLAGALFGLPVDQMIGLDAVELLRRLERQDLSALCRSCLERGEADHVELHASLAASEHWFKVNIAPVRSGLTLTFIDITDLKLANMALQSRAASLAIEIDRERTMAEALCAEIQQRQARECELQRMADTDVLTGLKNRRAMEASIPPLLVSAQARHQPVSFVLCDLDHFKAVNDTYGHAAGDQTLYAVAERLSGRVRAASDILARFGGEEFAIGLPGADLRRALLIAEDLRRSIAETDIITEDGRVFRITASFGVAEWIEGEPFAALFARADEALYAAKSQGRNRVVAGDHTLPKINAA